MTDEKSSPNRILLGQLISNGDCLYATAIAQQIKQDFPGCHLTWAVSSLCRRIIEGNPFIDEIWEIPLANWSYELLPANWSSFVDEALKRYEQGVYDFIFFTQIYPGNPHRFEGTVRPGIFLGYPGKITVPLQPSLFLREEEVERVKVFAQKHHLEDFDQVILFECSAKSGQTQITPEFAVQAAETIVNKAADRYAVILSSHSAVPGLKECMMDGSVLTLREMAELTKHCTLLIGCSSGISAVATSTWAKPLPMIQMLTNRCAMFASLAHDYIHFGLPTSHVIEMFDADIERLVSCFDSFLQKGWAETRNVYHEEPQIAFTYYLDFVRDFVLKGYDYYGFCVSLGHSVDRYGWHPDLEAALREFASKVLPRSVVDRATSPDELLSQLKRPARVLSSASIGMLGYDPPSIRPDTCLLSLRRRKPELEEILGATDGFSKEEPECSQLIAALLDPAPKEKIAILQAEAPGKKLPGVAYILALIQQAEYAEAREELTQWKRLSQSWSSQLEEVLADLDWMQGFHSTALVGYREALRERPNHPPLQNKIDRLTMRSHGRLAFRKSEVQLSGLGLVFYPEELIDTTSIQILIRSQLQAACSFGLETAYLTIPEDHPEVWSLTGEEELRKTSYEFTSAYPKKSPGCKKLIAVATEWATRKGKKWVALTRLDSIITAAFLRELQHQLNRDPTALIIERWDIPETEPLIPGLIVMRVDWWRHNRWRFFFYKPRTAGWIARYSEKISKLTKAAYLCGPEQRILSTQAMSSLAAAIARPNCPEPETELQVLQRSGLFDEQYYCEANPDVGTGEISPLAHYLSVGAFEGRRPNRLFDSAYYLSTYSDVAKAGVNPALHYFLHGALEGRDPSAEFDTSYYLEANPDVVTSGINPLVHFLRFGAAEGRLPLEPSPLPDLGLWPWQSPAQVVPAKMPSGRPWPRISIVTPSYQQGQFIEQTIRSVLMQGYPNLEYIVVDGGSTDYTQAVLRRYASELDVCISEADGGQADAINKGFQHSTGEILAWLNSDDMHLPSTLVEVALAFEKAQALNPTYPVALVCGRALIYSENQNAVTAEHRSGFTSGISKLPLEINDFDGVWQKCPGFFYQPEVFFTLDAWKKVGSKLNQSLTYALDYDLWIRMAKSESYLYATDAFLAVFRLHDNQKTKFGNTITYPEHQAVSLYHRANVSPDASYLPEEYLPRPQETIPPDIFSTRPVSYHETALGNYYVPYGAPNDVISRCIRAGRVFEPLVLETARQCIRPGTVVLDVGASYGQMTILFSHLAGQDGMVFSFEAQKYCFAILQKNIRANYRENVRAIYGAVLDGSREEVSFVEPGLNRFPSYGSYPLKLKVDESRDHLVKTLTIDELQIDRPISFVKVDVQGGDLFVLRGGRETILQHQMPILFEYEEQFQKEFGTTFEDYIDFIRSINYRVEEVVDGINYLIVPDRKRAVLSNHTTPSASKASDAASNKASVKSDIITITEAPFRRHLCKFLNNRAEVEECTRFLQRNGYVSHNVRCKDWDLAHIIPEIGHGNFLDMGSSDSYILKNVSLKKTNGKKYGIDRYGADVPISDVTYFKGDLLKTPLPDASLDYITCLSVIEHQVDYKLFAREVSRLLTPKGKLFVTIDYWDPLLSIPVKAYDLDWQPLDKALTLSLIAACRDHELRLVQEVDWSTEDQVIRWGYYSPHPEVSYTFGLLAFEKS